MQNEKGQKEHNSNPNMFDVKRLKERAKYACVAYYYILVVIQQLTTTYLHYVSTGQEQKEGKYTYEKALYLQDAVSLCDLAPHGRMQSSISSVPTVNWCIIGCSFLSSLHTNP